MRHSQNTFKTQIQTGKTRNKKTTKNIKKRDTNKISWDPFSLDLYFECERNCHA